MKPERVQRKRTKGSKMTSPNGLPIVYVGRPTKWGNPFEDAFSCPEIAVAMYRSSLVLEKLVNSGQIKELKGKNLACWCSLEKNCHADVLLEIANAKNEHL